VVPVISLGVTVVIDAAGRALARPKHRALAATAAVLSLAVVGTLAVLSVRPPAALGTGAPEDVFSAGRAFSHVEAMAVEPHPAGSAANDRVREHVVATLRGLGLDAQVQDTTSVQGAGLSSAAGGGALARVRNVVALLPGTAPTGRVFLVAHYDSVQNGPGGNDDAAGTSAILETARALTAGPRPRNDVVFVLTDAEEACLCGAKAFVDQHPLAKGGGVVLNLEARGSAGPSVMFETAAGNARLIDAFARAPHPIGTSFAVEVYRLLPNNTDFTAFREAGFTGLNSAYIDGTTVYHTPQDTPSAMDRDSLQHHGETLLAMARELGGRDLPSLRSQGDATYFPAFGALPRYPGSWTWPVAAIALLAVLALGWLARRRGLATAPRQIAAFGLALVPVAAVPAAAQGLWSLLKILRPGYAQLRVDPYHPWFYRLAISALALALVCAWYALLRRRLGPAALAVAGLGWLAVLGLALAAVAPGGSYLGALPAMAGALTGIGAIRLRRLAVPFVVLGAAAAVVVLLPLTVMFFPAMGMALAATGGFFVVLILLALLPVVDLLHPEAGGQRGLDALRARRLAPLPAVISLVAAVAFTAAGFSTDRFDVEHPEPAHLMYALDADAGSAQWLSESATASDWTAHYVGGAPKAVGNELPAFGPEKLLTGPAPAASLPAPLVTKTSQDGETITLRVKPQRAVRLLTLHVGGEATVVEATVAGQKVPVPSSPGGRWGFGFVYHAPPPEGVDVALRVRKQGPLTIRVMDASDGLDRLPGFAPRPAGVGIMGSHSAEMAAVAKTYEW
jgi:hypothetical protein